MLVAACFGSKGEANRNSSTFPSNSQHLRNSIERVGHKIAAIPSDVSTVVLEIAIAIAIDGRPLAMG